MMLDINVKPHVKKWLESQQMFGNEVIEVRRNTPFIGRLIWGTLSKYPIQKIDLKTTERTELPKDVVRLDILFNVDLSRADDGVIHNIGEALNELFDCYMFAYCMGRMNIMPNLNGSVKMFYKDFDIDADLLSEKSAFMRFWRFKNKDFLKNPRPSKKIGVEK